MRFIWVIVIAVFFLGLVKTFVKTSRAKKALLKGKERQLNKLNLEESKQPKHYK